MTELWRLWHALCCTYRPYERWVLIGIACLRVVMVVMTSYGLLHVAVALTSRLNIWLRRPRFARALVLVGICLVMILVTFVWADLVEYNLQGVFLGTRYNPFWSAGGNFEGWTGALNRNGAVLWNAVKCGPPPVTMAYLGDPGSGSFCHE